MKNQNTIKKKRMDQIHNVLLSSTENVTEDGERLFHVTVTTNNIEIAGQLQAAMRELLSVEFSATPAALDS